MSTDPALLAGAKPKPPRLPTHGELLFQFLRDTIAYRCELRDHGQWGVEAQILKNEELMYARRFDRTEAGPTARDLAIQWATEERKYLERG